MSHRAVACVRGLSQGATGLKQAVRRVNDGGAQEGRSSDNDHARREEGDGPCCDAVHVSSFPGRWLARPMVTYRGQTFPCRYGIQRNIMGMTMCLSSE